ncbi:MAG: hypothetical protein RLW61_10680 [Gammaproteobacteria bacterium]
MYPELMVIGDSLAQGVRSLSMTAKNASQSYASIIARSQGWEFITPDFERPVIFDLEQELQRLGSGFVMVGAIPRLRKNVNEWFRELTDGTARSDHEVFDSIAIGGLTNSEFEHYSAANQIDVIKNLAPLVRDAGISEFGKLLSALHLAINTAFTYNPSAKAAWNSMTQLNWVEKRKPRRLIAHFGHNDGLYEVGSEARVKDLKTAWGSYESILKTLDKLPSDVEQIVVLTFPKVSAVANLEVDDWAQSGQYHKRYRTVFPYPGRLIKGADLKKADADIRWFWERTVDAIEGFDSRSRFRVFNTFNALEKYDYKNTNDESRRIKIKTREFDNRYIDGNANRIPGPRNIGKRKYVFRQGGFQGLDGMHPSAIGYALLASELMTDLGLSHDREAIMAEAYTNERLVSNYNRQMHSFRQLLKLADDVLDDVQLREGDVRAGELVELCSRTYSRR